MLPMRTNDRGGTNRLAGLTTTGSPFALIDEMRREMDRVFEQALGAWGDPLPPLRPGAGAGAWMPTMDVQETEKELRFTVEVPGLAEDDLRVDVTDDVLTIAGEKKVERDETKGAYRLVERRAGRFERRLALPGDVDAERATAEYEGGVLTVTVPKRADAKQARRVEVKGSGFRKLFGRAKTEADGWKGGADEAHASSRDAERGSA